MSTGAAELGSRDDVEVEPSSTPWINRREPGCVTVRRARNTPDVMVDTPPADLDQVRAAFRLGWAVAELRGRYRPDLFNRPDPLHSEQFARIEHALPLADERKNREIRIEVFEAITGLCKVLGLDVRIRGEEAPDRLHALFDQMEAGVITAPPAVGPPVAGGPVAAEHGDSVPDQPARPVQPDPKAEPTRDEDEHTPAQAAGGGDKARQGDRQQDPGAGDANPPPEPDEQDKDQARAELWGCIGGVADTFYQWDAQLQDALAVPATQSAGYQLGRALAETYWALNLERSDAQMGSWRFLFGPERQAAVARNASRLSLYLGPLVVASVTTPFASWAGLVAGDRQHPAESVLPKLYEQGLLWRYLIRGEGSPTDLDVPDAKDVWRQFAIYRQAVETLKAPLAFGALFALLLVAGGALLAGGAGAKGLATAITILGALGVTSASLYARAKTQLTSLVSTLRERVQLVQVERAADLCPRAQVAAPQPAPLWKWLLRRDSGS